MKDPTLTIRRLGPGDEALLAQLAEEDADFDLDERGDRLEPLSPAAAATYLADPGVLHWVAESQGRVLGHLYCCLVRKRAQDPIEVLLYEIGVRSSHRRHGIGRALMETCDTWMKEHQVKEVWVLADNPIAVQFYRNCGFEGVAEGAGVYMAK